MLYENFSTNLFIPQGVITIKAEMEDRRFFFHRQYRGLRRFLSGLCGRRHNLAIINFLMLPRGIGVRRRNSVKWVPLCLKDRSAETSILLVNHPARDQGSQI